jgi:hypothetical protein
MRLDGTVTIVDADGGHGALHGVTAPPSPR